MRADFHLHSSFSGDADVPMEDMVKRGIQLGLHTMCFTEHMDMELQAGNINFEVDTRAYQKELYRLKDKYEKDIELLFGIELGLQPHLGKREREYLDAYPFDFVIGSSHVVDGVDPYYPEFFEGHTQEECYRAYFQSIIDNLESFSDVDTYGHLDYIVRYGPDKIKGYSYEKYSDILDSVLKELIEKGIGLEVNSAGYKYGLRQPNPHPDIIKRYQKLGGEIITIGSDAHKTEHIAYDFNNCIHILKECGFRYYTEFRKRKPKFVLL